MFAGKIYSLLIFIKSLTNFIHLRHKLRVILYFHSCLHHFDARMGWKGKIITNIFLFKSKTGSLILFVIAWITQYFYRGNVKYYFRCVSYILLNFFPAIRDKHFHFIYFIWCMLFVRANLIQFDFVLFVSGIHIIRGCMLDSTL
jgi:hypothetical protein